MKKENFETDREFIQQKTSVGGACCIEGGMQLLWRPEGNVYVILPLVTQFSPLSYALVFLHFKLVMVHFSFFFFTVAHTLQGILFTGKCSSTSKITSNLVTKTLHYILKTQTGDAHFYFDVKSTLHNALINSFIIFMVVNILTPFVMDINQLLTVVVQQFYHSLDSSMYCLAVQKLPNTAASIYVFNQCQLIKLNFITGKAFKQTNFLL